VYRGFEVNAKTKAVEKMSIKKAESFKLSAFVRSDGN